MLANGGICWWLIKDNGPVTWWGSSNFGGDLIATGFILPFIVAVIVIPIHANKIAKGALNAICPSVAPGWTQRFMGMPNNLWLRAVLFGLVGVVTFSLPTLGLLSVFQVTAFTPAQYAVFKGLWAGLLAFTLVMPMTAIAMATATAPEKVAPTT